MSTLRTTSRRPQRLARAAIAGVLMASALAAAGCAPRAVDGQSQTIRGVRFDYGVVRATVASEHPPDHPEASMHGGAPAAPDSYHVVLALFDQGSGARITDATVVMKLSGPGHPGVVETPMESMTVNGDASYGGYVSLPSDAEYRMTFVVSRSGRPGDHAQAAFELKRPR